MRGEQRIGQDEGFLGGAMICKKCVCACVGGAFFKSFHTFNNGKLESTTQEKNPLVLLFWEWILFGGSKSKKRT